MREPQYLAVRHKTVRKANALIQQSRFDLTMQQQKILLYLISQISPYDEDFKEYIFDTAEFCRVCGIHVESGKNYQDLKDSIKGIADKSLWVQIGDEDTLLRWIEKPYINAKSGVIRVRLDNDMKPFLLQLKQNYTQYELIFTLHFKSKYSIRLYELIKSIHYHELEEYQREYKVDELRQLLDAETYPAYRNLKQRVLIPSIREINEYSDKIVTMEEVRKGRKVLSIIFTIQTKPSLDVVRIRDEIDKELGTDQLSLWDELQDAGYV